MSIAIAGLKEEQSAASRYPATVRAWR